MNPLRRLINWLNALPRKHRLNAPDHRYFIENTNGTGSWYADLIWIDPKMGHLSWAYYDKILGQVVISQMAGQGVITSYHTGFALEDLALRYKADIVDPYGSIQDLNHISSDLS